MKNPLPLFDTLESLSVTDLPTSLEPAFEHDYRYAYQFLYSYRDNRATFNTYRREIERLLQWLQHVHQASLPKIVA